MSRRSRTHWKAPVRMGQRPGAVWGSPGAGIGNKGDSASSSPLCFPLGVGRRDAARTLPEGDAGGLHAPHCQTRIQLLAVLVNPARTRPRREASTKLSRGSHTAFVLIPFFSELFQTLARGWTSSPEGPAGQGPSPGHNRRRLRAPRPEGSPRPRSPPRAGRRAALGVSPAGVSATPVRQSPARKQQRRN